MMSYLTYTEYSDLGFVEMDQLEFNRLIQKVSGVLNNVTRNFYVFNELDDDVSFRRDQFKKAVACQIEYFHDMGATSSHEINNPLSVQIGRTQMSSGVENQRKTNRLVAPDVYMYLRDTGLLYRGLGVV